MSTQPSPRYLYVPAGRLYDEVQGSGPLLLVIGQPTRLGSNWWLQRNGHRS